jgi:molybdopterin-binding protein
MSTSIRNRLPGTIEQIVSDKVVSEIVINTAAGPVTSIITTGSVKRMNLKKGDSVFAIIKATESINRGPLNSDRALFMIRNSRLR